MSQLVHHQRRPIKCFLPLGLHPLWEEGQRSRQLSSTVVLVLCIWHWLPLPSHLGSDLLLVRDGSLRSLKESGFDPSVTSLALGGHVSVSVFIQHYSSSSTPCLVSELSVAVVPLHITLCLFKKGEESQVVSGSILCAANSPSYSPTL